MATVAEVTSSITAVQAVGDSILAVLETADPALDVPAATAGTILDLLAELVTKALTAYSGASGTPINATTIAALMPNPAPLSEPGV